MPKTRKPYPSEFREQLIALVRAGRTPEDLAREFEPTAQSISNWVAQADRDAGRRTDGLTTPERTELTQLRRENRLSPALTEAQDSLGVMHATAPRSAPPVFLDRIKGESKSKEVGEMVLRGTWTGEGSARWRESGRDWSPADRSSGRAPCTGASVERSDEAHVVLRLRVANRWRLLLRRAWRSTGSKRGGTSLAGLELA